MMKIAVVLAALVAVCSAGGGPFKVGYGYIAAGHGHYGHGHGHHGGVAKVNAHQDNHHYNFNVHENGYGSHRYHYQAATAYPHYGYGHHGGYGGYGYGGGYGGYHG